VESGPLAQLRQSRLSLFKCWGTTVVSDKVNCLDYRIVGEVKIAAHDQTVSGVVRREEWQTFVGKCLK